MANQLAKKAKPPSGCVYPLWAWWRWQGSQRPRPDLRAAAHLPKGTLGARIEFTIELSEVLLSDFDAWHAVLNNHYYAPDEASYQKYCNMIEGKNSQQIKRVIESSWQKIFDTCLSDEPESVSVQAVFWELKKEQIVDVKLFTAR